MRRIGVLLLLAIALFAITEQASANGIYQTDKDIFGNVYILDDQGRRDGKIEVDSQGNQLVLNRYGVVIDRLENAQLGSSSINYAN